MAAATFTLAPDGGGSLANKRVVKGTLTLSASYATGGDPINQRTEIGLRVVDDLLVEAGPGATVAGYQIKLGGTSAAPKILAYAAGGQVASGTDLDGVSFKVWFLGTD